MIEENPQLTIESLQLLEKKIISNQAEESDYEQIEYFLSSVSTKNGYLLEKLKEYNILSFKEYIYERKQSFEKKNRAVDGILLGYIIGSIEFIRDFLKVI